MQVLFVVAVKEMVIFIAVVIRYNSIEVDIFDAAENIHINGRICFSQPTEKPLDFATL